MSEITVKELTTQEDTARFWEKLHAYFRRDLFPQGEPGREQALDYFLGEEYRAVMEKHRTRPVDPLCFLAFGRGGADIGFAIPAFYPSEDGKCFIMEFWAEPEFRGGGTGAACAQALLGWATPTGSAAGASGRGRALCPTGWTSGATPVCCCRRRRRCPSGWSG